MSKLDSMVPRESPNPLIVLEDVERIYSRGHERVFALAGVNLTIQEGEMTAIMGPSGSGKSTLLHILGLLDRPTQGRYLLRGRPVEHMDENEQARIRNSEIGFVFQAFHLLARASALDNVMLPLIYARVRPEERRVRALQALESVGLLHRATHRPSELSGGERQRVAIARALVNHPAVLLADEPTGNLDSKSGREVMDVLTRLWETGQTILIVTHSPEVAQYARRIIQLLDGRIVKDTTISHRVEG